VIRVVRVGVIGPIRPPIRTVMIAGIVMRVVTEMNAMRPNGDTDLSF